MTCIPGPCAQYQSWQEPMSRPWAIFFIGQGQWLSEVDSPQEVLASRTERSSLLA